MPTIENILFFLGLLIVAAPVLLLTVFFAAFLADRRMQEGTIGRLIQVTVTTSLLAALSAAVIMLAMGVAQFPIELGDWVITPNYHLKFEFVLDLLSLSYVTLSLVLCGTIGAFSTR